MMMFEIWSVLPKQVVAYLEWSKFKEWKRSNDRREQQKNMETSVKVDFEDDFGLPQGTSKTKIVS